MTKMAYFHVFETIIYGLMVAKWLTDANNLYTFRAKIKFYWPYLLLVFLVLLKLVNSYYENLDSKVYDAVNNEWFFFHVIILPPLLLYSLIHHLFPDKYDEVNLRSYILTDYRRIFFSLSFLTEAMGIYRFCIHHSIRTGKSAWEIYLITLGDWWFYMPHLGLIVLGILALRRSEILLKIYVIVSLVVEVIFYFD